MKRTKKLVLLLISCLLLNSTAYVTTAAAAVQETASVKTPQKQCGWFKNGKYTYYRMKNGKLCTKQWVKLQGKYYSFDSKGRVRKGLVTAPDNTKIYFSKKDGHFVNYVLDVTVVKKYSNSLLVKDAKGGLYDVGLSKMQIVDKNGKNILPSLIKKGSKIQVLHKGMILETNPAQFASAYKIKLIK